MDLRVKNRQRFSTGDVPPARRVSLWESHNEAALVGLSCRMMPDDFTAEEVTVQVGEVDLGLVRATPHAVERDRHTIERSPVESVVLYATLAGESFFYHRDGVLTTRPGQVVVCDVDRPFMRGFSQDMRELVVKIPRTLWAASGGGAVEAPRVIGSVDAGDADPYYRALASAALGLLEDRPASATASRVVSAGQLAELALALGAPADGDRTSGSARAHLRAAQAYVEQHLGDPGLCAARIASGVGLSERHLSRVFAQADLGIAQYVTRRRMLVARRLLEERGATMTVGDVSVAVGFTSAAGFTRAFRAHLGVTPSEVRRSGLAVAARVA